MRLWTERPMKVGPILLVAAALLALLLALPGQTVTTRYLNDLFVILDGAYRVAAGQVPNQDFHTPLGPLTYYLTAAGYALSGTLGGTPGQFASCFAPRSTLMPGRMPRR